MIRKVFSLLQENLIDDLFPNWAAHSLMFRSGRTCELKEILSSHSPFKCSSDCHGLSTPMQPPQTYENTTSPKGTPNTTSLKDTPNTLFTSSFSNSPSLISTLSVFVLLLLQRYASRIASGQSNRHTERNP